MLLLLYHICLSIPLHTLPAKGFDPALKSVTKQIKANTISIRLDKPSQFFFQAPILARIQFAFINRVLH